MLGLSNWRFIAQPGFLTNSHVSSIYKNKLHLSPSSRMMHLCCTAQIKKQTKKNGVSPVEWRLSRTHPHFCICDPKVKRSAQAMARLHRTACKHCLWVDALQILQNFVTRDSREPENVSLVYSVASMPNRFHSNFSNNQVLLVFVSLVTRFCCSKSVGTPCWPTLTLDVHLIANLSEATLLPSPLVRGNFNSLMQKRCVSFYVLGNEDHCGEVYAQLWVMRRLRKAKRNDSAHCVRMWLLLPKYIRGEYSPSRSPLIHR